ncbi:hypothetical protein HPB47_003487, partial [Ixodes persulcatus]
REISCRLLLSATLGKISESFGVVRRAAEVAEAHGLPATRSKPTSDKIRLNYESVNKGYVNTCSDWEQTHACFIKALEPRGLAQDLINARRLHLVHFKASHWKPFLRCIDENLPVVHVDSQCRADAQRFVQAMLSEEPSGLSLLDSLGSLPTGVLRGSVLEYGSPELCFGAEVRNKTGARISSKFCHVYVYLPADVPVPPVAPRMQQGVQNFVFDQSSLKLGGCFPSTCGDQDISLILNQCLATWQLATVVSLCDDNEPWEGPPLFVMSEMGNDPTSLYYTPYVHFVSYCLGILAAFYHSNYGTDNIGKGRQVLLWVASLLCMSGVLFGSIMWNSGGEAPSPWVAALYKASHRALFSAGLCWIMFACVTGRAATEMVLPYHLLCLILVLKCTAFEI